MEEFFKNGFNWMVSQFGASMQSVTERLPWGILLLAGVAALFLLYAGYTVAHFVARGKYKKQLAEDIDAFDESKLSRKAIGLDAGSVGIIVIALLFLTGHAGFWAENGAAGFALCALLLCGAAAVFKLAHELCYHACRAAVRRAYWEISAEEEEDGEDDDDDEEDDEDGASAPVAPPRPAAVYSPFSGGDDVYVPRPAAEPVKPVAPPVDADALRPGILEEIRKLKEEETPQAPMTEEEVLENLKEFGEEAYEDEEDGEEGLGAILAETLQDADYDYEDMDQRLTEEEEAEEPVSVPEEAALPEEEPEPQPAEEPVQAAEEAPVEAVEPEEQEAPEEVAPAEEPESVEAEAEQAPVLETAEEVVREAEAPKQTPEEPEPAEAEEAPQPEPSEESPEPSRTAKQLGDEEILREIERLKNSKPVPPESKAARRIPADAPEKETVSEPAPEKPARKKAPTSEELIDQARLARQTADNSEESMKTMQQIALLLQKEREKKKRKTPEEQRRMNEALADLLRAIGKKDE